MNNDEATRIAAAINMLRPEWGRPGLTKLLQRDFLAARPGIEVALALTFVACDPASRAPTRVLEHGPWWELRGVRYEQRAPEYRRIDGTECVECGLPELGHRWTDHAYTRRDAAPVTPMTPTTRDQLKAALTTEPEEAPA